MTRSISFAAALMALGLAGPAVAQEVATLTDGPRGEPVVADDRTKTLHMFYIILTSDGKAINASVELRHFNATPARCEADTHTSSGPVNIRDYLFVEAVWCD